MLSKHHLLLSIATGLGLLLVTPTVLPAWLVVGLATALGVLIDLDHFLLARLNQGDWHATIRGLRNPRLLVLDQAALFHDDALWARQRLLSHALIGTLIVAALLVVGTVFGSTSGFGPWLALISATTIWVHLLADMAWDCYHMARDFERHARHLGYDV